MGKLPPATDVRDLKPHHCRGMPCIHNVSAPSGSALASYLAPGLVLRSQLGLGVRSILLSILTPSFASF